jgi:glycosyltransferase involved in cell wall biosynthesis
LEPLYDVATLVRAIPLMMERSKRELRFVILGEGSQKSQLLDLAIKLGVETHLDFKGVVSREALLELYRESDVYVSTSTSDSTSVSLLEAMNFGLIPVVTDIPGNREWIQDGNNGFLFTASSPEALAEKILYAIDHSEAADGFREKNREIILSWAVWENNMRIIEERFKGLTPASA